MRHLKRNAKLGRKGAHRNAMLANMVCSLIKNKRVTTTLAKAKAVRPVAEKMVTLGKKGAIHHRRLAASRLHQEDAVKILFNEIAPGHQDRQGGYTRIIKLHERRGDAAQMAIIEFVESGNTAEDVDTTSEGSDAAVDGDNATDETSITEDVKADAAETSSDESGSSDKDKKES